MQRNFFLAILITLLTANYTHMVAQSNQWYQFKNFNSNCFVNFNGQILIGTNEGIFSVDPIKLTQMKLFLTDDTSNVVDFFKVNSNKIWCLTTNRLYLIEHSSIKEYPLPDIVRKEKNILHQVCEATDGTIYLGTYTGYFKGDSVSMQFFDSRKFVSPVAGVRDIMRSKDGRVFLHYKKISEQWHVERNAEEDGVGEFLLIEEKKDPGTLRIIEDVKCVAVDGKGNLWVAVADSNTFSFKYNKKVFSGKKILKQEIRNLYKRQREDFEWNSTMFAVDPKYKLIDEYSTDLLGGIMSITPVNEDSVSASGWYGGTGDIHLSIKLELYDEAGNKWEINNLPVLKKYLLGDSEEIEIPLKTANPHYHSLPTHDILDRGQVKALYTSNFLNLLVDRYLLMKDSAGWCLNDLGDPVLTSFEFWRCADYKLRNPKYGKPSLSIINGCMNYFLRENLTYDLGKMKIWDFKRGIEEFSQINREGTIFSLVPSNYTRSDLEFVRENIDWDIAHLKDTSLHRGDPVRISGAPFYFEQIAQDDYLAVSDRGAYLNRLGKWIDLSGQFIDQNTVIHKVTFIPEKVIVLATNQGLVEITPDLKVKKTAYPAGLEKISEILLLEFDCNDILWFSTEEKIYSLEQDGWKDRSQGVRIEDFYNPSEDPDGIFAENFINFVSDKAFGTYLSCVSGTYKLEKGIWRSISNEITGALCFDHKGNLMIAGKYIFLYNPNGIQF